MNEYKSKKHQIQAFVRRFLKEYEIELTTQQRRGLNKLVKDVASTAMYEERSHCINSIDATPNSY